MGMTLYVTHMEPPDWTRDSSSGDITLVLELVMSSFENKCQWCQKALIANTLILILKLKLPSLFIAWLFCTFHNKSHHMNTLVILSHSPFLPLTFSYGKRELLRVSVWPSGVFSWEKSCPRSPMHITWPWPPVADLVMAWLPYDKRKCELKVDWLVFVYILLSTCQWVQIQTSLHIRHACEYWGSDQSWSFSVLNGMFYLKQLSLFIN